MPTELRLIVCAVCHTRINQIQPSGLWIHAVGPRPWHIATPTPASTRVSVSIDTSTKD